MLNFQQKPGAFTIYFFVFRSSCGWCKIVIIFMNMLCVYFGCTCDAHTALIYTKYVYTDPENWVSCCIISWWFVLVTPTFCNLLASFVELLVFYPLITSPFPISFGYRSTLFRARLLPRTFFFQMFYFLFLYLELSRFFLMCFFSKFCSIFNWDRKSAVWFWLKRVDE